MKNSLSSDRTRPAIIDGFVLMVAGSEVISSFVVVVGVADAASSRLMKGLPDSGHPSNSSSSSFTVGNLGMSSKIASFIVVAAAGADHVLLASYQSKPISLYGFEMDFV